MLYTRTSFSEGLAARGRCDSLHKQTDIVQNPAVVVGEGGTLSLVTFYSKIPTDPCLTVSRNIAESLLAITKSVNSMIL